LTAKATGLAKAQPTCTLFDHVVSGSEQRRRHVNPNDLADFRFIVSANFVGCITGRSAGRSPFRMRPQ
jgi:hypothetical protein